MSFNCIQARKTKIKELLKNQDARIHFVGILGAGMKPLALLLLKRGYTISGSDSGEVANDLPPKIAFYPTHACENIKGASLVVASFAIDDACPELVAAQREGIPVVYRADLLGALMEDFVSPIGVCGTHGKSTTTAMLHRIFSYSGLLPTTICGAKLECGSSLVIGKDDFLIYEACEYRDAFLSFSPKASVVLNIELDHTDYFHDISEMLISYASAHTTCGQVIFNIDDPLAHTLYTLFPHRAIGFGTSWEADYRYRIVRCDDSGSEVLVNYDGGESIIYLSVIGRAAAIDAVAAFTLAHSLGLDALAISEALSAFHGIGRRLEKLCTIGSKDIYYDYAHHPTEILNTVSTLRGIYGRVAVVFRPHTFSRTEALFDSFVSSLSGADSLVILDTFAARESKGQNRGAHELAEALSCPVLPFESTLSYALGSDTGAVVLMGAGDITPLVDEVLRLSRIDKV